MTVRPLRLLGDPVLRTPCDPVVRFDDALARLVGDLLDTVAEPGRAGLAANQIGSGLAVFAYNVEGELGYLINPRVVELGRNVDGPEGCLSIPGVSATRSRADHAAKRAHRIRPASLLARRLFRCVQRVRHIFEGRRPA